MKAIVMNGRLVADPTIKEVGEKKAKLASFRMANNDGERDTGEFYDVHCWDKLAQFVESYLKKGSKILLQGSFENQLYQDKEGKNRTHFEITATKIEFM